MFPQASEMALHSEACARHSLSKSRKASGQSMAWKKEERGYAVISRESQRLRCRRAPGRAGKRVGGGRGLAQHGCTAGRSCFTLKAGSGRRPGQGGRLYGGTSWMGQAQAL